MENWISIWMLVFEFSALAYLLVMLLISMGWYLTKVFDPLPISNFPKVSVVIAVRNEAENINDLLTSLLHQTYPKNSFEIIIVDDNSDDKTLDIVKKFKVENTDLNMRTILSSGQGKKEALKDGFEATDTEIIITTDGDCIVGNDWIKNYVSFLENDDVQLAFGPVFYHHNKNLIQKIFSLEFSTLVASGAGSAGLNLPLMGNGANMAFRKSTYDKIKSKLSGTKFASGDDVFLMHSIATNFGNKSVKFIKNMESIVETSAPENFTTFLNQRLRWGSKAKAYKRIWPMTVSLVVFLFNVLLGVTALLSFFKLWFLAVFVLFVILKFLIDFPLTRNFLKFYNRSLNAILLFPFEFFYPFYIMITALFSIFIPYQWKGRKRVK